MTLKRLLPTLRANDPEKRGKISDDPRNGLPGVIQHVLLPTPKASDGIMGFPRTSGRSVDKVTHLGTAVHYWNPSTSSTEARPASPHQLRAFARVPKTTIGSGRKLLRRFLQRNRDGCSSKIQLVFCLLTMEWSTSRCAHAWKEKVIGSRVLLYLQARSERRTDGTACGLLPTPIESMMTMQDMEQAKYAGNGGKGPKYADAMPGLLCTPKSTASGPDYARKGREKSGGDDLVTQIAMLRTPRASDADHGGPNQRDSSGGLGLMAQIAMLPTLTSRDYRSEKCSQETYEKNSRPLSETLGKNTGIRLQPAFVEWMMGFPENWTKLDEYPANPYRKIKPPPADFTD